MGSEIQKENEMKKTRRDYLKKEYDQEISKANRNVTISNQPGKSSPRWQAAIRNLNSALEIAIVLGWKKKPSEIQERIEEVEVYQELDL